MTRGRVEPKDVAADRRAAEVRKLSTLVEISQALAGTLDLRPGLHRALELLEQHHSVVNAAVTLRDEENGDLDVVAANPRAPGAARASGSGSAGASGGSAAGSASNGKGRSVDHVTDQVIRTGRSVVIPDIDHEPLLKAKLGDRSKPGHRSFIAVPILLNRRPAGALTVELAFKSERLYDRSAKFFGVVASMIGQALKVQKLIEAERQRLVDENVHLRQELRERYDFLESGRHQQRDPPGLRAGRAGRAHQHHRADSRRIGHRQGADRARDPLQLAARAASRSSR